MVANCTRCGHIYIKSIQTQSICPSCIQATDKAFKTVSDYLKEHSSASLADIVRDVDVDSQLLEAMIRSGKLRFADGRQIGVTCERCGADIPSGHHCEKCQRELLQELSTTRQTMQQNIAGEKKSGFYSR